MDGNLKRQAQRAELHGVGEKVPYRSADDETVRRVAAASGVYIVDPKHLPIHLCNICMCTYDLAC